MHSLMNVIMNMVILKKLKTRIKYISNINFPKTMRKKIWAYKDYLYGLTSQTQRGQSANLGDM